MKNILSLITISALAMVSASAFSAESQGQSSAVKFTGTIKENTCVLANASEQTVDLGAVEVSVLSSQGSVSQPTSFTISLEQCNSANAYASITFSGDTATGTDSVLKVTGEGTVASGVGIQILEGGNPLKVDGSASSDLIAVGTGKANEFSFAARYIALENNILAGKANAMANFTVKYQ